MEAKMTLGELKKLVDGLNELHGPDVFTTFVFQKSYGKVGNGHITSYRAGMGVMESIHFHIDSPIGKVGEA
jgi:hypothetical protein